MSRRRLRGLAALTFALSASALATVVESRTIEELSGAAPVIVRGRVGQVQTRWDDGHRRINTYAEVATAESIKGKAPGIVLVRQPGGEVGPIGQRVSGAASFREGEEVVLFLDSAPDEAGIFTVFTMAAGKIGFEKSATGELRAVRHLEGLAFYDRGASGKPRIRSVDRDDLGTPEQLLQRVRTAVAAKAGGGR